MLEGSAPSCAAELSIMLDLQMTMMKNSDYSKRQKLVPAFAPLQHASPQLLKTREDGHACS
jgi:hypothetical protein